jgi:hypothetical protein
MGLSPSDPIDVLAPAARLGAEVRNAEELVDITKLQELEAMGGIENAPGWIRTSGLRFRRGTP